jgi:hypothetical protein
MLIIDTSAWIEHLQRRDSPVSLTIVRAVKARDAATTDQVVMEVLAGTTDPARAAKWQGMLNACRFIQQRPYADALAAAQLYRACRRAGETPRNLSDCLIAAVALRTAGTVLHRDRDFEVIARHTALQTARG